MSSIFYVDLPDPDDTDGYWTNVATFDTREEAIEFVRQYYDGDDQGRISPITEGKYDEEDEIKEEEEEA